MAKMRNKTAMLAFLGMMLNDMAFLLYQFVLEWWVRIVGWMCAFDVDEEYGGKMEYKRNKKNR